jgi:hypothetical protein
MTDARTAEVPDISEEQVEAILDEYKNVDVVVSPVRLAMVVPEGWNIAQVVQARMRAFGVTTVLFSDLRGVHLVRYRPCRRDCDLDRVTQSAPEQSGGGRGRLTPVAPNMRRTVARSRSAREG